MTNNTIVHFHFVDEDKKNAMANLESTIDSGVYDLSNSLDRKFLHEAFDHAIDYIFDENPDFVLGYDSIEEDLQENREDYDEDEIEEIEAYIAEGKQNEKLIEDVHQAISSQDIDKIENTLFNFEAPGFSFEVEQVETLYDKLIENGYPVSVSHVSDSLYTVNDFGEEVRISDHTRPSYGYNGIYQHEYTNELILEKDKKITEDDLINEGIEGVRIGMLDDVYLGNNGEDVYEISQELLERIKENQGLDGSETIEELEELEIDSLVIDELLGKAKLENDLEEFKYTYKTRGFSIGCQPKDFIKVEQEDHKFETIFYSRRLTPEEIEEYELIDLQKEPLEKESSLIQPIIRLDDELEL